MNKFSGSRFMVRFLMMLCLILLTGTLASFTCLVPAHAAGLPRATLQPQAYPPCVPQGQLPTPVVSSEVYVLGAPTGSGTFQVHINLNAFPGAAQRYPVTYTYLDWTIPASKEGGSSDGTFSTGPTLGTFIVKSSPPYKGILIGTVNLHTQDSSAGCTISVYTTFTDQS